MTDTEKYVEELINKAAKAVTSEDAMRFSQAAFNAANAVALLTHMKREHPLPSGG